MDTFKNFAIAQVVTPPSPPASGASLTITPGTGAYMPPVPFTITVFDGASYATPINAELIRVTAIVGDTLSGLVRAIEGSTARAIKAGDYVAQTLTAQFVADVTNSSNQSAGMLPDARLSANVALRNATNVFTQYQEVMCVAPVIVLIDTNAPVDGRQFNLLNAAQSFIVQAVNDAGSIQQGAVIIDRAGTLTAAGLGETPLNASQLTSGALPDARLSANVARRDQANIFEGGVTTLQNQPLRFSDTGQAADHRLFNIASVGGNLYLQPYTDALAASATPLMLGRNGDVAIGGDVIEKGRLAPMGHWIDVPFSAANFGATGGFWTVAAENVARFSYALIGKTAVIQLVVSGSVVSGSPTSLNLVLPFTILAAQNAPCYYYVAPDYGWGFYGQQTQDQYMRLQRDPFSTPFAAASGVQIYCSATVQIL
jgi:hypothetical protein